MADKYIDSNATGTGDGTSWANAFPDFDTASYTDSAGDVFYVASDHSESTAASVAPDWAGTAASPTRIICADKTSGSPPTTIATGAVIAVTGANSDLALLAGNDCVYFYGIRFKAGDSTNAGDVVFGYGGCFATYENCAFELAGNNTGSDFTSFTNTTAVFKNCTFKSANASSTLNVYGRIVMEGCSIESGGTPGAPFFGTTNDSYCTISGFDFTNLSSSANLFGSSPVASTYRLMNCKLPSSWSGSINSSTPGLSSVFDLSNSDSADTNYRIWRKTKFGEVTHETTIKRTGGASDGTTTISWKMVSNADAEWSHQTLDTPEMVRWNERTGTSVTATIEIVHDSVTNLTDKEIWLEAMYLGTSGYPLGSVASDAAANYLSTGADQTASTETWTTTGLTNPNKQKLSVTFTPQEKGTIRCVVKLAAASKTVYVDPKLNVTY